MAAPRSVHLVTRLNAGGIARYLACGRDAVDVLLRGRVERGEVEASWEGPQRTLVSLRRSIDPARDARALIEVVRHLRALDPGVVHTHAGKAGALGRAAARLLGLACVHTFHGHVLDGYFGRAASALLRWTERRLARSGCVVTATGPATAHELERLLRVPVGVVLPGVELPPAAAGAREIWRESWGEPARVALAVARPAAVKDLGRFARAARAAGYLPVVAGSSHVPGALALGHVERMADLYAACDVVVCSSRREGTPYALLEAAWCGRPVVAPPVGDVEWIVGGGGIVTSDLAAGLKRLRDPGLRSELGFVAAEAVRRRFPANGVARQLRELYAALAA